MKSKSLLFLFSFSVVATFIIGFNSCKKVASEELLSQELNTSFNAATAKEWYYGIFKKSSEWKSYYINTNSKIASAGKTGSASSVPKLPDWGHPSYRKAGNLEIVEFPLVKSYKDVSVPSAGLSASDQKRIAEASLTRIVFIKDGDKIDVREVDYIPEMESLRKMNFDLSSNTVNKLDKNFSGRLVIKKWDGTEVGRRLVVDGKIVKRGIIKKSSEKIGDNLKLNSNGNRQVCSTIRITEYERFCIPILDGDNIQTGEYCTEWTPTGFSWQEEYCYEVPDEEDCVLYGTCDLPGDECGGCETECTLTEDQATELSNNLSENVSISSQTDAISFTDIDEFKKRKDPKWICLKSLTWKLISKELGIIKLVDATNDIWNWESLTHSGISLNGIPIGGTVTSNQGIGTPSFVAGTSNVLLASMSLNFDVTFSPAGVANCPGLNLILAPYTYNYTSTSVFWDAKPF